MLIFASEVIPLPDVLLSLAKPGMAIAIGSFDNTDSSLLDQDDWHARASLWLDSDAHALRI